MMHTRRKLLLGAAASTAALILSPRSAQAVILGAGPAGARTALRLARLYPGLSVVLVERDPSRFEPVPMAYRLFQRANTSVSFAELRAAGVSVLLDEASGIDWRTKRMALHSGRSVAFDRLFLAAGAQALDEDIEGLDARSRHLWPAAWGSQREARRLQSQMARLPENGHVVLRLPAELSHPQVALERVLWLAGSCKNLTVLDAGQNGAVRHAAQSALFDRKIDWYHAGSGGIVVAVNAEMQRLSTELGDLTADVVNFVPAQGAGRLARKANLVDETGWCPVDDTGKSLFQSDVSILGDIRTARVRTTGHALRSVDAALKVANDTLTF